MQTLPRIQFGNPLLRKKAGTLSARQIRSARVQALIANMQHTLVTEKLGIALAAPQVGQSVALVVIAIRPTAHRPKVTIFDQVLINPVIVKKSGKIKSLWEGCISAGSNGTADLFAKVPRYSEVTINYLDDKGQAQVRTFKGLKAQVVQHEVDHLHGIYL